MPQGSVKGPAFCIGAINSNSESRAIFWLSDTPTTPGSIPGGTDIREKSPGLYCKAEKAALRCSFLNVHLPSGKNEMLRSRGVRLIHAWILEKLKRNRGVADVQALLLAGDFNAAPDSTPHALLTDDRRLPLLDVWEVVQPNDPHPGTYGGWEGLQTKKKDRLVTRRRENPSAGLR